MRVWASLGRLIATVPHPAVGRLERGARAQGHAETATARAAKARAHAIELLRRYHQLDAT